LTFYRSDDDIDTGCGNEFGGAEEDAGVDSSVQMVIWIFILFYCHTSSFIYITSRLIILLTDFNIPKLKSAQQTTLNHGLKNI